MSCSIHEASRRLLLIAVLPDLKQGRRMKGDGVEAESIHQLFKNSVKRFFSGRSFPEYDFSLFKRPARNGQLDLFG